VASRINVRSYHLDSGSETEFRIQVKKLPLEDANLLKVIDDLKSWFTRMEVLDSIYHQFFFTANSLGRQLTTSQFFQLVTPQTLAFVAAAIHCALSEYATGTKVTVMFSQDDYQGTFGPSTVKDCINAEDTALINYTWCAASYPPPPMVLLRYDRCCSIPIGAP